MHYGSSPIPAAVERLRDRLGPALTVFAGGAQDVLPVLPQPRAATPRAVATANPDDRYGEIPRRERGRLQAGASRNPQAALEGLPYLLKLEIDTGRQRQYPAYNSQARWVMRGSSGCRIASSGAALQEVRA